MVASIGWIRYAFLGLALSGIFIARLFSEITGGFKFDWNAGLFHSITNVQNAYRFALTIWLAAMVAVPLTKTILEIALPGPNYAQQMAAYLDENVPMDAVIETWDPEIGFLTNHSYHYPPNALLAVAVDQVYYGGDPVQDRYDFIQTEHPDYLLVGEFSKWTELYPLEELQENYELLQSFGDYDFYQRIK
jgi:hypothetical protein